MTFRQRLIIAFTMVLVLPTLLFMISFIVIGNVMAREGSGDSAYEYLDYASLTDDYRQYSALLDRTYDQIQSEIEANPAIIEDPGYLQSLSERVSVSNSYIIVRKGKDLYYTGNEEAAASDFQVLPAYSHAHQNEGTGYYIDNMVKMVKQLDFTFEDGSEGSIFIITVLTCSFTAVLVCIRGIDVLQCFINSYHYLCPANSFYACKHIAELLCYCIAVVFRNNFCLTRRNILRTAVLYFPWLESV